MYYLYLLKSQKDSSWYVGYASDLKRRLLEHNSGKEQSTKSKVPWELMYYEAFKNQKHAEAREKRLKHHGKGLAELKKRIGF